jgi:serine protease Do
MFLSAVSAFLLIAGPQDGLKTAPLRPELLRLVAEQTVVLQQAHVILGEAVRISDDGLAIAPGEVAFDISGYPRQSLIAISTSNRRMPVKVEGYDCVTDLALGRLGVRSGEPARLAPRIESSVVMVAFTNGAARAQISRREISGIVGPNKRYLPLNEIRLEAGAAPIAGSPVFAPDGKLIGILMAQLQNEPNKVGPLGFAADKGAAETMGPLPSATAFALDLPVLRRVISGFLSESHQVVHPYSGVFFKTSDRGPEVTGVVQGGPADIAGFRERDIVLLGEGQAFRSHVDFAAFLFNQKVGDTCDIVVDRNGERVRLKLKIGKDPGSGQGLRRSAG